MRNQIALLLFTILFSSVHVYSQAKMSKGQVPPAKIFHPDSLKDMQSTIYHINSAYPKPAGIDPAIKAAANERRNQLMHNSVGTYLPSKKRTAINPVVEDGFQGATIAGTPNDNNVAVNNDSFVISVMNTYIRVYNTSGQLKKNWGLEFFPKDAKAVKPGNGADNLDRCYDPKVVFDPVS